MDQRRRGSRSNDRGEIGDGLFEAFLELDRGLPTQAGAGQRDIGLALLGIIGRERLLPETAPASGLCNDFLGKLPDRELVGVAEVDRSGEARLAVDQLDQPGYEVVDIAERAGLLALAEDGDRLALQSLDHKVGY